MGLKAAITSSQAGLLNLNIKRPHKVKPDIIADTGFLHHTGRSV